MRPVPVLQHKIDVLHEHCRAIGRDPATVRKSLTRVVYLAPTRVEAEQRAGGRLQQSVPPFAGEPAALVDHLRELVELGFDVFQLIFAGFPDTADLRLFVDRVLPGFD
jgi:alkanesulfonate monooxygenase SsuD/methylene tetrahydromethanopterin reductase-like flavin-dependent oxidoreductase (luciferase family)